MEVDMNYRHGDVILKRTDKLNAPIRKSRKVFVLAEGETTGHAHRLRGKFDIFAAANGMPLGLAVKEPTALTHEEHGTITLEPGDYEVAQERAQDTDKDLAYQVAD
jgi:hypothetical protein